MAVSPAFRAYVGDLFEPLGAVTIKSMFGALGLYHKGVFFCVVDNDRIYLKVDDATRPKFERAGSKPAVIETKDGPVNAMSYWEIPARLLDDPEEFTRWARESYETAVRVRGRKTSAKPRAKISLKELPLKEPKRRKLK